MAETAPLVSVVMGVYNGGPTLPATLNSILSQQGVEFEFVIVNDGSTDDSMRILAAYAERDSRIKLVDQENRGLTRALIRGCELASGPYIARQDAGDVSLPGRLQQQVELIEQDPSVVLVSGGTRFMGPAGEWLYTLQPDSKTADWSLRQADAELLACPPHPCVLFRRDAYYAAGAYRPEFRVAQDLDLWTRMVERGKHSVVQSEIYEFRLDVGGISSVRLKEQQHARRIIVNCMKARMAGRSDDELLLQLQEYQPASSTTSRRKSDAAFFYFVGSCLLQQQPDIARGYFLKSLKRRPMAPRTWIKYLGSYLPGQA